MPRAVDTRVRHLVCVSVHVTLEITRPPYREATGDGRELSFAARAPLDRSAMQMGKRIRIDLPRRVAVRQLAPLIAWGCRCSLRASQPSGSRNAVLGREAVLASTAVKSSCKPRASESPHRRRSTIRSDGAERNRRHSAIGVSAQHQAGVWVVTKCARACIIRHELKSILATAAAFGVGRHLRHTPPLDPGRRQSALSSDAPRQSLVERDAPM